MNAGEKIRLLRLAYGLTLAELAEESGVGPATICHLENGTGGSTGTRKGIREKIANALCVEPSWIWGKMPPGMPRRPKTGGSR